MSLRKILKATIDISLVCDYKVQNTEYFQFKQYTPHDLYKSHIHALLLQIKSFEKNTTDFIGFLLLYN